ncbi:MAG: VWA domain-containing protein [Gammaproteobacteria bacterium]|nr:VWA domain-containing protein [Gammaproteobacteria bacterium]
MNISRNADGPLFRTAWLWLILAFLLLGVAINYSSFRIPIYTYRYLFVLDITQSMNVNDLKLGDVAMTRHQFAKSAIETALRNLPCGSEAGLAIFTAHRTFLMFTPVEICEHYRALSEMLEKVDWRMAWEARSEVAKGLYSALDAARQIEGDTRLVFLTDGHEAPPLNRDIRPPFRAEPGSVTGFIAGIGGTVPNRIPHMDNNGNVVGYWSHEEVMQVDIHSLGRAATVPGEGMDGINMANVARRIMLGQEHLSSLQENHLQELAEQTGLDYVRVESPLDFLETLRKEKYARRTPLMSDMGWIPAMLAFVCLSYCLVVIPRRNSPASANRRPLRLEPIP